MKFYELSMINEGLTPDTEITIIASEVPETIKIVYGFNKI